MFAQPFVKTTEEFAVFYNCVAGAVLIFQQQVYQYIIRSVQVGHGYRIWLTPWLLSQLNTDCGFTSFASGLQTMAAFWRSSLWSYCLMDGPTSTQWVAADSGCSREATEMVTTRPTLNTWMTSRLETWSSTLNQIEIHENIRETWPSDFVSLRSMAVSWSFCIIFMTAFTSRLRNGISALAVVSMSRSINSMGPCQIRRRTFRCETESFVL